MNIGGSIKVPICRSIKNFYRKVKNLLFREIINFNFFPHSLHKG